MLLLGQEYDLPEWINALSLESAVKLLLLGFFGTTAPSGSSPGIPTVAPVGASNLNTYQASSMGASALLVQARATRRSVLIRNLDTANTVWVGPTPAALTSFPIKPGESIPFTFVGAIYVIDNGSHALLAIADEYN